MYVMEEEIQKQVQTFLGKEQEITDSLDLKESLEVLENLQVIRGIMTATDVIFIFFFGLLKKF